MENVPFANGAPNLTVDVPRSTSGRERKLPPDRRQGLKTGQTMMKTGSPPRSRRDASDSRLDSTNILGNRDGECSTTPNVQTKEEQAGVSSILQPEPDPELYGNVFHRCGSHYPPRGETRKAGTTSTSSDGRYPMQIKVDFLCRDLILAAPIVLDLALFFDLAQRRASRGSRNGCRLTSRAPDGPGCI